MSTITAAYDNIRLLRRKIDIAEGQLSEMSPGAERDASVIRLANLTQDLVRALHDFAAMGYEEEIAEHLMPIAPLAGRAQAH